MQRTWSHHLKTAGEFVLMNFIPPIAFFTVFETIGAKPAIAVAVTLAILQLIVQLILGHKLSPFFLCASFFTVVFGAMDFFVNEPKYFRLAPFAENIVLAALFLGTVLAGKPIALWFAQALPVFIRPDLRGDIRIYLRNVTIVWAVYFALKGVLFLYIALQVDLGKLVILRSIIGGGSLALMFGGEIFYRKKIRRTHIN